MKTRIRAAAAVLFLTCAFAQTQPAQPPPGDMTRIFTVRYANVNDLAVLLSVFGAKTTVDKKTGALAVHGTPATLTAIEEAIHRLDVPPASAQNAEIEVYMLIASQNGSGGAVPKELDPVVKQLKGVFSYQNYRLLDTAVTRARDGGSAKVSGILPMQFDGMPGNYELTMRGVTISPEGKERSMRFSFSLNFRLPYRTSQPGSSGPSYSFRNVGVETDVDVREGQKVVVGKSNIDGSNDALVLVVTAKLVN